MSNTITTGKSNYGENKLIEAPEKTDNVYRLDVGGMQILFDKVEMSNSRGTFTFTSDARTTASIEADVVPDKIQGALSVISRNS